MDKDAVVTDKDIREFANKKLAEAPDELFWRILWLLFLFDSCTVMDYIKDEQVEEVKSFYKKDLLYELKVSKLKGEQKKNENTYDFHTP